MKRQLLTLLIVLLLPISLLAQDGYAFTLTHNGGYSFSVAAVPNYDSGIYTPKTESYGFTLVVPDGVALTVDTVLPTGSSETVSPISGASVVSYDPTMADKDLYLITVTTNAANLPSHINGANLPLVTFTVNGTPLTGELTVLDNGSTLASNPTLGGSLDSYIQVDVTDDATANFINGYLGQTEMATFSFNTLGIIEIEELGIELYPNPTQGIIHLNGNVNSITKIDIYNLAGQYVKTIRNQFNTIDISDLESAVYLLKITNDNSIFRARIIKN